MPNRNIKSPDEDASALPALSDEGMLRVLALKSAQDLLSRTQSIVQGVSPAAPIKRVSIGNYADTLVYLAEYILNGEEPLFADSNPGVDLHEVVDEAQEFEIDDAGLSAIGQTLRSRAQADDDLPYEANPPS